MGSIQPFLALAIELKKRGHTPVLALFSQYYSWAKRFGIDFVPIDKGIESITQLNSKKETKVSVTNAIQQIQQFLGEGEK